MSAKDIITVGMIRRVNERLMEKGVEGGGRRPVRSEFLGREVSNPVQSDAESINYTWARVQKRSLCG